MLALLRIAQDLTNDTEQSKPFLNILDARVLVRATQIVSDCLSSCAVRAKLGRQQLTATRAISCGKPL
jgi:hypothetical protein